MIEGFSMAWVILGLEVYIVYIYINIICIFHIVLLLTMVRVFDNSLGDRGLIPGRVIPNTQEMLLDAALLITHRYKLMIKGKLAPSPTLRCSSY